MAPGNARGSSRRANPACSSDCGVCAEEEVTEPETEEDIGPMHAQVPWWAPAPRRTHMHAALHGCQEDEVRPLELDAILATQSVLCKQVVEQDEKIRSILSRPCVNIDGCETINRSMQKLNNFSAASSIGKVTPQALVSGIATTAHRRSRSAHSSMAPLASDTDSAEDVLEGNMAVVFENECQSTDDESEDEAELRTAAALAGVVFGPGLSRNTPRQVSTIIV